MPCFKFSLVRYCVRIIALQERGLWGNLRSRGLEGIDGVMFNFPDGMPKLVPKPATPEVLTYHTLTDMCCNIRKYTLQQMHILACQIVYRHLLYRCIC